MKNGKIIDVYAVDLREKRFEERKWLFLPKKTVKLCNMSDCEIQSGRMFFNWIGFFKVKTLPKIHHLFREEPKSWKTFSFS